MRSGVRSSLRSFGLGLVYSALGCGGLVGAAFLWSPPGAEHESRREVAAVGEDRTDVAVVPELAVPSVVERASDTQSRRELTRAIQQELIRVGCLAGQPDGAWNGSTRDGMAAFNSSVRVELPVNGPDYILLTLLQGHSPRACDASRGQPQIARTFATPAAGRMADEQVARPQTWATSVTQLPAPAAPRPVAARRPQTQPTTTAAAAPIEPVAAAGGIAVAAPAPVQPIPGRMAVGGPASEPALVMPPPAQGTTAPGLGAAAEPGGQAATPAPQQRRVGVRTTASRRSEQGAVNPFARLARDAP